MKIIIEEDDSLRSLFILILESYNITDVKVLSSYDELDGTPIDLLIANWFTKPDGFNPNYKVIYMSTTNCPLPNKINKPFGIEDLIELLK